MSTITERLQVAPSLVPVASEAPECTKGRFFDRVSDKLSQLARFATNELVSFDLQAMVSALNDEVTSIGSGHGREEAGGHPLDSGGGRATVVDQGGAPRQRCAVKMTALGLPAVNVYLGGKLKPP